VSGKKLCLVIPSLQAGGMERVMSELAGFFCKKNEVEVHLVLYGRRPDIFYDVPETLIIHKPKAKFNNRFRQISSIRRLLFLRRVIIGINPDSILSFGEYWNSFVLLALFGLNFPIYVSDRCQPDKDLGKFHNILRRWLYPRTKGVIAQTSRAKEIYQKQFKHNNIRIIGNPIHKIDEFADQSEKENIVLTVGRLIKTKNHDKLIELFVSINKPGWKLIIIGDDAQNQNIRDKLISLIKELNAEDMVILAGKQSNVEQYYRKSKIFAFTSSSEGFPNVIGEAQSVGLPVIAFDCTAGPSDMIVDNINGFLIPLFDYNLFESKLRLLMKNEELRNSLGRNARETIKTFSLESVGESYYYFVSNARN
jgi:GalNAc-alpha-(1->4)-GalNAc-alpha-(1->3)-diNAcBac-PP-undecaprenol alpha-1,4-N-acetyl-D-galactosaminyltransferase